MGTMAAWMLTDLIFQDEASGCKTHHEYGKWLEENGRDLRVQGRNYLKEFPTAQPFLAKERSKAGGEEETVTIHNLEDYIERTIGTGAT